MRVVTFFQIKPLILCIDLEALLEALLRPTPTWRQGGAHHRGSRSFISLYNACHEGGLLALDDHGWLLPAARRLTRIVISMRYPWLVDPMQTPTGVIGGHCGDSPDVTKIMTVPEAEK